jgi:hypothetical protein
MPNIEEWLDEKSQEFGRMFGNAIYSFVVVANDQRYIVSNANPEGLQEVYADLADEIGRGEEVVTKRLS